jgi:hypothetical protein
MSRAGYTDDDADQWSRIRWRGQVESALRGKRGQAFLRELIAAMDALPEKRLISGDLIADGAVCALGAVGLRRGVDLAALDPHDPETLADVFGIAHQMIREIEFMNDEVFDFGTPGRRTPERRWQAMRDWAERHLIEWDAP